MSDDDEHKPHHATARPPPGEEDVYSASTVVGEASDEILAIIRGENPKVPAAPAVPKNLKPSSEAIKTPVAEPVKVTPPASLEPTSEPPRSVEIAPDPEPAPSPPAPSPPAIGAASKTADIATPPPVVTTPPPSMSVATDDGASTNKSTLHPAVGIVLFFIAVVIVLAALIR